MSQKTCQSDETNMKVECSSLTLGVTVPGDDFRGLSELDLKSISLSDAKKPGNISSKVLNTALRRGQLRHHCLPISCMKLFDSYLLVVGEGPSLLMKHSEMKDVEGTCGNFKRYQIFPNQLTITGIEFIEDSCGYPSRTGPWDGPDEYHSVAFIWAGNHGLFLTLDRPTLEIRAGFLYPENCKDVLAFEYIPIAARWFDNGRVLVLLSVFNYVVIYERESFEDGIRQLKEVRRYECDPENLYSGTMDGDSLADLVVFSGTTFKGILIWTVVDGEVEIQHRLTGHQGIVFSLEYYSDWRMLLSASDDRSVIIWAFNEAEDENNDQLSLEIDESYLNFRQNHQEKKKSIPPVAKITHRFVGHEARAWKAIWVKHGGFVLVVSVGEDSWVRMNSFDRASHKFWKAHDGSSIYHCAYDQSDDLLYTAANDGSIFCWKRFYLKTESTLLAYDQIPLTSADFIRIGENGRSPVNKDFPRSIVLWDFNYVLATMDSGRIISFYPYNQRQFHLFFDERLKRYSIPSVSPTRLFTAVGGLEGDVILLKMTIEDTSVNDCQCLFAEKVWEHKFEGKILNIVWVENYMALVVCLNAAYLVSFDFEQKEGEKENRFGNIVDTFPLNLERPGLPTAIKIGSKYLIAGDETGALLIFTLQLNLIEKLSRKISHVHHEGVTHIIHYNSRIMTAGRYGGIKSFKIDEDSTLVNLIQTHELIPPFEWVGKLLVTDEDLLIGGFQKGDFVIYSWNEKRVLNEVIGVGGGHRRWDFKFGQGSAAFAYIRDKEIYYSTTSIEDRVDNVLKPGFHCKTVNCGIAIRKKGDLLRSATGSEDGTIRIFGYNSALDKYFPMQIINRHASSVRALACVEEDDQHELLFSAGGRSELFAFLIGIDTDEVNLLAKTTLVKPKNRETEIDTRIMDLSVLKVETICGENMIVCFCACSDGVVRTVTFSTKHKKFLIVSLLHSNGHSVMRVQSIRLANKILVLGATSNGCLIIWNWKLVPEMYDQFIREPTVIPLSFSQRLRNSAIMSFKLHSSCDKDNEYFITVGSDDCGVSSYRIEIPFAQNSETLCAFKITELWANDQEQRGSVIGIEVKNSFIYSCSNDQIVAVWDMQGNFIAKAFSGVSDCQGFIVNDVNDCITCFGNGITWISRP